MNAPINRMVESAPPMMTTRPTGPRKNFVSAELPGMRNRMPRFLGFAGTKFHSRMAPAGTALSAAGAGIKVNVHPIERRADRYRVLHVDSHSVHRPIDM